MKAALRLFLVSGEQQLCVCAYLDLAGILGIVDVVKGLFDRLPESNHAVIPQHQNLQCTHMEPADQTESLIVQACVWMAMAGSWQLIGSGKSP